VVRLSPTECSPSTDQGAIHGASKSAHGRANGRAGSTAGSTHDDDDDDGELGHLGKEEGSVGAKEEEVTKIFCE
jgi:hypothetical protein